ncbi:MAG TPA: hypothetical protein VLE25_13150 [Nitrospira sp.]|nr:hypothetical protein [Nitrospira sp.]
MAYWFLMVSPPLLKRILPLLIGAGLLALIAVLLTSNANEPSRSIPKPPGTSTLSHGGPQPAR